MEGLGNIMKNLESIKENEDVSIYEVIRHPELVYWRTGYSDPEQFVRFTKLAKQINKEISKCDGKDGRPTPMEALSFYRQVLTWGGGVYFTCAIHPGPKDEGFAFLKRNVPEGVSIRDWCYNVNKTLVEYCEHNLIPSMWNEEQRESDMSVELSENGREWYERMRTGADGLSLKWDA